MLLLTPWRPAKQEKHQRQSNCRQMVAMTITCLTVEGLVSQAVVILEGRRGLKYCSAGPISSVKININSRPVMVRGDHAG